MSHPKIPDHPRFRTNPETGEDEFLVTENRIGFRWWPVAALVGIEIEDCGNAAWAAWRNKADGLSLFFADPELYEARDFVREWAAWAKEAP